ncbi:MAG: sugar ABC transporter substrate-binding protein [Tissierellia bacterium]|nr:sugar ABC transporter substrate-binding protein [Tissierellia bacterium]
MKRKFKVIIALMLVFVMVLSACGPKKEEKKQDEPKKSGEAKTGALKGTISLQVEEGWKEYYEKVVKKITDANPEAKIELKVIGSFEHLDLLNNTDATNPDFADVFALPADRLNDIAQKGALAKIDAEKLASELGGFADFKAGLGGHLKYNNEYVAFPYNIETLIVFVNKANAKAAGIDDSKPFELNDAKDPSTVLLPIFNAWYGVAATNSAKIELLTQGADGKFVSTLTKPFAELSAEEKALFEGLYKYWKSHADAATPLFDLKAGWGFIDDQFKTGGKGVMRLEGPWATSSMVEKAGENLEIYPITQITIAGKPLAHWQGGWGLAINSRIEEDADKLALATAVIKEIVNPETAVELFKSTGKILENVPVEVYEKSDLKDIDKKVIKNVIESYKISPPRPLFKEYGKVWATWENAVLSWNNVKPENAEKAYEAIKASFDSMMTNIAQ